MSSAIWLFVALPIWFFSVGLHDILQFAVIVCLVVGASIGVVRRQRQLLWFLAPVALSQGYVAIAGLFHGMLREKGGIWAAAFFLGFQLVALIFAMRRAQGAWATAVPIAVFCLVYALFAWFIGGMAFSDDWL